MSALTVDGDGACRGRVVMRGSFVSQGSGRNDHLTKHEIGRDCAGAATGDERGAAGGDELFEVVSGQRGAHPRVNERDRIGSMADDHDVTTAGLCGEPADASPAVGARKISQQLGEEGQHDPVWQRFAQDGRPGLDQSRRRVKLEQRRGIHDHSVVIP
jgi:hypothetical protein